jgi:hypothetical protein
MAIFWFSHKTKVSSLTSMTMGVFNRTVNGPYSVRLTGSFCRRNGMFFKLRSILLVRIGNVPNS